MENNKKPETDQLLQSEVEEELRRLEAEAANPTPKDDGDFDLDGENPDVEEGSTTSFGFASEREIKKAKAVSSPAIIRFKAVMTALPFFLIIGAALGVAGCYWFLFGFNISGKSVAAGDAASAAETYFEGELGKDTGVMVIDLFIKNKVDEYECIVFVVTEGESAAHTERSVRVVINKSSGEKTVYGEFDPELYDRLMAGSPEERVKAGVLLNYKLEFDRCMKEIDAEKTEWVQVSRKFIDYINVRTDIKNKEK